MKFDFSLKMINFFRKIWIFDSQIFIGFILIEKFGNRDYLLNVEYVIFEDDAEYWVVVKNVVGEVKLIVQLIV